MSDVVVNNNILQEELKYNNTIVLTYKIEYPQFTTSLQGVSLTVINKYYLDKAADFQHYCRTELFNMAVENYKLEIEFGLSPIYFRASLTYSMQLNEACILSLYFDKYEFAGGAHGITTRDSQTWNINDSKMLLLGQLYGCSGEYTAYIIKIIEQEANKKPDLYFNTFKALITDKFNPSNFYCRTASLIIYYQIYDIAPFVGGIVEFSIPYSDCIKNPVSFCSK